MDAFRRAMLELHGFWRSLPPGSRMTAGLLAAALLLGLGYLGTRPAAGPDADLMHGVPVAAGQLPAMVSAFAKANLKGYEIRGTSILVPRGQEPAYLAALADAQALPLGIGDVMRKAADPGNIFESREQREQRTKVALQDALAGIIRSMAGIEGAYVLYDVDNKPGGFTDKLLTAAVSVKPVGSAQLDPERVSAIRHFVAGAIAGLKPENVTVSDANGPTWYGKMGGDRDADENLQAALRRMYEQDLKAKILGALAFIPHVTAEVSVVLERKAGQPPGPGGAAVRSNTGAAIDAPSGGPGDENELPGPSPQAQSRGVGDAGLTPISARVSVGVPASYLKKIWQERHADSSGQEATIPDAAALDQIGVEEAAKIRRHVAQLLPPNLAAPAEQVTVTTFEDLQAAEPPPPGLAEQAWNWLAVEWRSVGLAGLALVGLLWLRSVIRHNRAPKSEATRQPASTSAEAEPPDDEVWQPESRVPPPHWRRPADPALHRQLSELVEADPETAAGILRNWIGQAS